MADAIAINKADGDNVQKAQRAKTEYLNALHLFPPANSGWDPKVLTCSALTGSGIEELWQTINEYKQLTKHNGYFEHHRNEHPHQFEYFRLILVSQDSGTWLFQPGG